MTKVRFVNWCSFRAMNEVWISADNTATSSGISNSFVFSHTPRPSVWDGETCLLNTTFEYHAITVTNPAKIHFVLIYHPSGQLENFLKDQDMLFLRGWWFQLWQISRGRFGHHRYCTSVASILIHRRIFEVFFFQLCLLSKIKHYLTNKL